MYWLYFPACLFNTDDTDYVLEKHTVSWWHTNPWHGRFRPVASRYLGHIETPRIRRGLQSPASSWEGFQYPSWLTNKSQFLIPQKKINFPDSFKFQHSSAAEIIKNELCWKIFQRNPLNRIFLSTLSKFQQKKNPCNINRGSSQILNHFRTKLTLLHMEDC